MSVNSLSFRFLLLLPEFCLVLVSRNPRAKLLPVAQRPAGREAGLSQEGSGRVLGGCEAGRFTHREGELNLQQGVHLVVC